MTARQHILLALNVKPQQYAEMVEKGGYEWLNRYFFNDEATQRVFYTSPEFWKWWINQWDIRDREFVRLTSIDKIGEPLKKDCLWAALSVYSELHDIKKLAVVPSRPVIRALNRAIVEQQKQLKNHE